MEGVALGLLISGLFIGAIVFGLRQSRRNLARLKDRWHAYAARRGGRFARGHDGLAPTLPTMAIPHQGVEVVLSMYLERKPGGVRQLHSAAVAPCAPGAPVFRACRAGPLSHLGPGAQRIAIDVSEIDRSFVVEGFDDGALRALWTPQAQRWAAELPGILVQSDGRAVTVRWNGYEAREEKLDGATSLAAALARPG